MTSISKAIGILLILATFVMSGCITQTTMPAYAKRGDLIQLGLGGIKRNAMTVQSGVINVKSLTGSDVIAEISDDGGTTWQRLGVAGTFRAYPDYTSWYARDSLDRTFGTTFGEGNVLPYDGMWWVTVGIEEFQGNPPLVIADGPAIIRVTSVGGELTNTGSANGCPATGFSEGNMACFPIEILSGSRTPTNNEFNQWAAYRHQQGLIIKPADLTGVPIVGGLQLEIDYNNSAVSAGPPRVEPRIVPLTHDPNISIIQSTVDNGDGTSTLTAMITNPNGFVPSSDAASGWSVGQSEFKDLVFALIAISPTNFADWNLGTPANFEIDQANTFYIDDNSAVISGLSPVMGISLF